MPVTTCPKCGCKMISKCPNCGYDLAPSKPSISKALPPPTGSSGGSASFMTGSGSSIPPPIVPTNNSSGSSVSSYASTSGSMVPVSGGGPPVATSILGPLPSYLPPRSPDLEGHIIIPPATYKGLFTPVHWAVKFTHPGLRRRGGRPNPNWETNITSVRVRRDDGAEREARMEGEIVGGSVSLGDPASFWGTDVSGTLIVDRAYNHKTGAEIRVRPPYNLVAEQVKAIFILGLLSLFVLGALISALSSAAR